MKKKIWSVDIEVWNTNMVRTSVCFWRNEMHEKPPKSYLTVTPSSLRRAQRAQLRLMGLE
jgi:hypothetical protein